MNDRTRDRLRRALEHEVPVRLEQDEAGEVQVVPSWALTRQQADAMLAALEPLRPEALLERLVDARCRRRGCRVAWQFSPRERGWLVVHNGQDRVFEERVTLQPRGIAEAVAAWITDLHEQENEAAHP